MNWMSLIPSALSAVSSLFGSKPPTYQQPAPPNLGQMAGQLNSAAPLYDPTQGSFAQSLNSQLNQGLPPAYANAVMGQAQAETQTAFNQASQGLQLQQTKDQNAATANMNKLGLLSSGALGVQQGYINQAYGQQYGNLAANEQNQLSGVATNLMTQSMQQRQNIQNLLAGFEGDKTQQSTQAQGNLTSFANAQGTQGIQNAANQYQSGLNQFQVSQARFGQGLGAINSAGSTLGLYGQSGNMQLPGQGTTNPYQLNLTNPYFKQ